MKRTLVVGLALVLLLGSIPVFAHGGSVTKRYGTTVLREWENENEAEVWDLTQCDLILSYELDASKVEKAGWSIAQVGLREVGGPNVDPNDQGGWMQLNYASDSADDNARDNNDYLFLAKHGWGKEYYDADIAGQLVAPLPLTVHAIVGFWFDRDGVHPSQESIWGYIDGVTYNTKGKYDIAITYRAIDKNTATMVATINGEQQTLDPDVWHGDPSELVPMGRSFTGDMTSMQVFYGRGSGGGRVKVKTPKVVGCLAGK